jgi:molybdate transport system substrate-binding protein
MQNPHNVMRTHGSAMPAPCGRRRWLQQMGLAAMGTIASIGPARAATTVGVAVAASVQTAMEQLGPAFKRASDHDLKLSFGASGNLVRQIEQGLPVELFLSADEEFADRLVRSGWARDAGVVYATGRLALLAARGTGFALDPQLRGLAAGWPDIERFAIANPTLAPYGRAAREALQSADLWAAAQPRLVQGENVAQAAQFVGTGSAQAGLTALSLVVGRTDPPWRGYVVVDSALHQPLRQRMVLRRGAGPVATAFYTWLQTDAARTVLQSHGFS